MILYTNLMDLFQALILGIIEGITEFLPISSTGHLILAGKLLLIPSTEFVKTFEVAIQSGAILSVIVLYGPKLIKDTKLLKRVMVAFIPTGILGLILYKIVKTYLLGNSNVVLLSLFWGGIALIAVEWYFKRSKHKGDVNTISYKKAAIIGIFQAISMVPGVSRAAATIFGGMFMGLSRKTAVEFSFILAIPTMLAATALDLSKTSTNFTPWEWTALGTGFTTSFLVAIAVIKWLLKFIERYSFVSFGIYRIILSVLYFLLIK